MFSKLLRQCTKSYNFLQIDTLTNLHRTRGRVGWVVSNALSQLLVSCMSPTSLAEMIVNTDWLLCSTHHRPKARALSLSLYLFTQQSTCAEVVHLHMNIHLSITATKLA